MSYTPHNFSPGNILHADELNETEAYLTEVASAAEERGKTLSTIAGAVMTPVTATINSLVRFGKPGEPIQSQSGGSTWKSTALPVVAGERYFITTCIYGDARYGIYLTDPDDLIQYRLLLKGDETAEVVKNYAITIPDLITHMYVNCRLPSPIEGTILVSRLAFSGEDTALGSDEITALATVARCNRGKHFINLGYITDTHANDHPQAIKYLDSLRRVTMTGALDDVYHGGDILTTSGMSLSDCLKALIAYINYLKRVDGLIFVQGNHDVGHNVDISEDLSIYQYDLLFGNRDSAAVRNDAEPYNSYWYRDYSDKGIRVICLETFSLSGGQNVSAVQLAWLQTEAFAVPSGYTTVILAHYLDDSSYYAAVVSAIAAFASEHKLAGVVCGHRHQQMYDSSLGFNLIVCGAGYNGYSLFTVDTESDCLIETCVGGYASRAFHFGTGAGDNYLVTEQEA